MYYYLLLNKFHSLKCNLIDSSFDKFARIWMQDSMMLRVIITRIVFQLDLQIGVHSVPLTETINYLLKMTKCYLYYVHM